MGVGRSMLVLKAFAKRLKNLGIESHIIGGITTPPIVRDDLLIADSGSGETMTTLNIATLAKDYKAKVFSLTSSVDSSLIKISDNYVIIPSPDKYHNFNRSLSIQPMANLFEQSLYIFFDCISIVIKDRLGITEQEMLDKHANLE